MLCALADLSQIPIGTVFFTSECNTTYILLFIAQVPLPGQFRTWSIGTERDRVLHLLAGQRGDVFIRVSISLTVLLNILLSITVCTRLHCTTINSDSLLEPLLPLHLLR